MKQKLIAALVSVAVGGILIGGAIGEASSRMVGNSVLNSTQEGFSSGGGTLQLQRVAVDRVPPPAWPECTGDATGTVPLLTFFFNDRQHTGEPDPEVKIFPCGTFPEKDKGLFGFLFPSQDKAESDKERCNNPAAGCARLPGGLSSHSPGAFPSEESRGLD